MTLLEVQGVCVNLRVRSGNLRALNGIDLTISPGETVCLVGESGSGKTITALSILRLIDYKGGRITEGAIRFEGRDFARLTQRQMSALRGRHVGMVFQEPTTAFDPLFTIGAQITEVIQRHLGKSAAVARKQAIELLERVRIPEPARRIDQHPHELSGGMRQRAMIAMALACSPKLLIADEPTTALDVTIQTQILSLLKEIQADTGLSILFITHDLGVAATLADRVVVMYAGRIIEDAAAKQLFERPAHPYTRGLLDSMMSSEVAPGARLRALAGTVPDLSQMPTGCAFHPRCPRVSAQCRRTPPSLEQHAEGSVACFHPHDEPWAAAARTAGIAIDDRFKPSGVLVGVIGLSRHYSLRARWLSRRPPLRAVDDVSLCIAAGETLGLVGESGSGKSTLGRLLLHLEQPTAGRVEFAGQDLSTLAARELRATRRDMQMIFQDPNGSLDPRWTIGRLIEEPLVVHGVARVKERREQMRGLLELVGLDPRWDGRFPHQLSGGQRQRVAIARALALRPRFIVADEAVSALDVSVRAQIINLFQDLKEQLNLTYLFIGHDLNIVRHISDRIGVMYQGRLVEMGPAEQVFHHPAHPYTQALLAATQAAASVALRGETAGSAPAHGCRYLNRCPIALARCRDEVPLLAQIASGHAAACHQAKLRETNQ